MPNTVRSNPTYPSIEKSDALYERAAGLIPAFTQTLAKGPGQYVRGVAPKYLRRGKGSHVWDVDGNEYIDYQMGIGPLSLGYCYERVDRAIAEQLKDGITFSMMHPLEVEVAEMIREAVPQAEMVRYSKTGCDVTTAAVRLARAYTGRDKVLCCGYHGWHDWYIAVTDRNAGIPQAVQDLTYTFNYNDINSVIDAIDERTACVILEPVVFEPPKGDFLQKLREVCTSRGVVLIFDEMWTGFRLAAGGAQQFFGVDADLATYSKAIANGMPLGVIAGRGEIMRLFDKDVFFFTTFGGEALSLAAAKATIAEIREKNVPAALHAQGKKIRDAYNALAAGLGMQYTRCSGMDCRTLVSFDKDAGNPLEIKSLLQQELFKRGILWGGSHNMSFSHTDADVAHTIEAYGEALPLVHEAVSSGNVGRFLKGTPVDPVFRRTGNFNTKPAVHAGSR
ncbi:MAG TPA: aminotransferase class III-fold pyridoxal phosphate-dependent enzyme [Bacteroidota bacterium]|nr:aminotransferase class III-fold pyridoxal phosphate-dependent enzyme [Bacteroidota bacterium]